MNDPQSRLERALEAWLEFQERGGGAREELLAGHADLADLLQAFFDEPPAQAPDDRLLGDFRIVREVGRGGCGIVYEARQRSLDRRVALKVLPNEAGGDPAALARFRREALHLARCDHPGIVAIYDVGADGGRHWLAMEFVAGESLAQRLDGLRHGGGHRGDSLRALVTAIAEVAEALEAAHGGIL